MAENKGKIIRNTGLFNVPVSQGGWEVLDKDKGPFYRITRQGKDVKVVSKGKGEAPPKIDILPADDTKNPITS